MNLKILSEEIQIFLTENKHKNPIEIGMQKSPFSEISSSELAQQIQGIQISKHKFPFLYSTKNIYFPPHLNLEQASSEFTAQYKQQIIQDKNFKTGIDLTGGSGIDSFFLSKNFIHWTYIEPNTDLLTITEHNFSVLGRKNTTFLSVTAEDYLKTTEDDFNFAYIDPSRRDSNKSKKFLIEDLVPNVLELQNILLQKYKTILIKFSPLLDIQSGINQLKNISAVFIVAVKNEVKELLFLLDSSLQSDSIKITAINLESSQPEFSFIWEEEKSASVPKYSEPLKFVYLPNVSILKSGAFKLISEKFNLQKLHPNTHLYTSDKIIENFPGRIFEILEDNFNPKKAQEKSFNIICRNYPAKPEQLCKKYKLSEGGSEYLIFTQSQNKKHILRTCLKS